MFATPSLRFVSVNSFSTRPKRRSFESLVDGKTCKIGSKLQYRFTGPHPLIEVFNPLTYKAAIDGFLELYMRIE